MTHLCFETVRTFIFSLNAAVRSFLVLPSAEPSNMATENNFAVVSLTIEFRTWFRTAATICCNA